MPGENIGYAKIRFEGKCPEEADAQKLKTIPVDSRTLFGRD